jgi:hypothetical protein
MCNSRSFYGPTIGPDGSRSDFRTVLDEHGSTLGAVCLWRADRPAAAEEGATRTLARLLEMSRGGNFSFAGDYTTTVETLLGEPAYRYSFELRNRRRLTEWKLVHASWLFVVGVLSVAPPAVHEETLVQASACLATWEWIDA